MNTTQDFCGSGQLGNAPTTAVYRNSLPQEKDLVTLLNYLREKDLKPFRFNLNPASVASLVSVASKDSVYEKIAATQTFKIKPTEVALNLEKGSLLLVSASTILQTLTIQMLKYNTVGSIWGYDFSAILVPMADEVPLNGNREAKYKQETVYPKNFRVLLSYYAKKGDEDAQYVAVCVLKRARSNTKPILANPSNDLGFDHLVVEIAQQPPRSKVILDYNVVVLGLFGKDRITDFKDEENQFLFTESIKSRIDFHLGILFRDQNNVSPSSSISKVDIRSRFKYQDSGVAFYRPSFAIQHTIFPALAVADEICMQGNLRKEMLNEFTKSSLSPEMAQKSLKRLIAAISLVDLLTSVPKPRNSFLFFGNRKDARKRKADNLKCISLVKSGDWKHATRLSIDETTGRLCDPPPTSAWKCIVPTYQGALRQVDANTNDLIAVALVSPSNIESDDLLAQTFIAQRTQLCAQVLAYIRPRYALNEKYGFFTRISQKSGYRRKKISLAVSSEEADLIKLFYWTCCLTMKSGFLKSYNPIDWATMVLNPNVEPTEKATYYDATVYGYVLRAIVTDLKSNFNKSFPDDKISHTPVINSLSAADLLENHADFLSLIVKK